MIPTARMLPRKSNGSGSSSETFVLDEVVASGVNKAMTSSDPAQAHAAGTAIESEQVIRGGGTPLVATGELVDVEEAAVPLTGRTLEGGS